MIHCKRYVILFCGLLLAPAAVFAQADQIPIEDRGTVEVGVRHLWGSVYGRPDLAFKPDLFTSKLTEYTDLRNDVFVRQFRMRMEDVFGTKNFIAFQTRNSLYRNQSYLVTFGQYNRFSLQFRYDQIPHIFTNTARSIFTESSPGFLTVPAVVKSGLQAASSTGTAAQIANTLPSYIATQVVPSASFIVPSLVRKTATGIATVDVTRDWKLTLQLGREKQSGSRPHGMIFNSSPSASASSSPGTVPNVQSPGTGVEFPEPIRYVTSTVRALTEYGKRDWGVQAGYLASILNNKVESVFVDNPFATADVPVQLLAPGGGCTPSAPAVNCAVSAIPARGRMGLYPDNQAHYLNFAGAFDATSRVRVMGTVNPGWLRQDDPFVPYTSNAAITNLSPLPAPSLRGNKQTLAMNWTAVTQVFKKVQLAAKYRHYDYNNNTPELTLNPVQGDVIGANSTATGQALPGSVESKPFGYNKKTMELTATYFLAARSSAKIGYSGEWFDREHRDVRHSREHTVFGAVDLSPNRDLLFRVAYRHGDRKPEDYEDEEALRINGGIPADHPNARRFDESARLLDRGDVLVEYNVGKFTLSGTFQTIQQDFNRKLPVNSLTPLNFLTGTAATTGSYYIYGALKDLSHIYTFSTDYALSKELSLFAEYAHERYHKRMISRSRSPGSTATASLGCGTGQACDTPNNDWESTYRDTFNTYSAGVDIYTGSKLYLTTFYSLSAGIGKVRSSALGDPRITSGPNRFTLTGTSAALDYPDTATRLHELVVALKVKLPRNITPKLEYRLQQFDNRDYQTTPMTPYMGCIGAGSVSVSAPCINVGATVASLFPSPFYPGSVVGDTAAARYLFLGADQPSFRAHILALTLQYHF
jgi:MtrB/PioB family decaheme-associated outer membrane protein